MYGDAAGFNAYFEARNKDVSAYDDEAVGAALLVASEWIDGVYGNSFVGRKTGGFLQTNEWPRISATVRDGHSDFANYYTFPDNAIPDRVKDATYEAALRQLVSPGSLQPDYTPNKYKKVTVDGAISVEYAAFSSATDVLLSVGVVDTLLWPLLCESAPASYSSLSGASSRL